MFQILRGDNAWLYSLNLFETISDPVVDTLLPSKQIPGSKYARKPGLREDGPKMNKTFLIWLLREHNPNNGICAQNETPQKRKYTVTYTYAA